MSKEIDFAADVAIDEHNLWEELLRQPMLYQKWSKLLADANLNVSRKKLAHDIAKAEMEHSIRKDPQGYDINKLTETQVASMAIQQPSVKKAKQRYNNAMHDRDVKMSAVAAMSQRKSSLENLCFLHGQNYFSEPKLKPGSGNPKADQGRKRASKRSKK